jgi:hypothetical protein
MVSQRITMDKDLSNKTGLFVGPLQLLWNNVFTLTQLENVFYSIDDSKLILLHQLPDVSCSQPSVFINSLTG